MFGFVCFLNGWNIWFFCLVWLGCSARRQHLQSRRKRCLLLLRLCWRALRSSPPALTRARLTARATSPSTCVRLRRTTAGRRVRPPRAPLASASTWRFICATSVSSPTPSGRSASLARSAMDSTFRLRFENLFCLGCSGFDFDGSFGEEEWN